MKYCKNCGASLNDEAMFCSNCGEKFEYVGEVVSRGENYSYKEGIKERNLALAIVLTVITCGIYGIYWMVKINDEALKLAGEKGPSGVVVFLLNIITCGIYGFFWSYKMGVCTDKLKGNSNGYSGILYILLMALGLGIVNYALIQDAINNSVNG